MKHLESGPKDSILTITSAGDNVLHFAAREQFGTVSSPVIITHVEILANRPADSLR